MRRWKVPASYGIVGKKAMALYRHGHHEALAWLSEEPSLGFHSTSHSEHPTIAEDLSRLSYQAGVAKFLERESVGVRMVTEFIKAPGYFTQPGGNWVPEALEALPRLDIDVFFTDSFNSYVIDLDQPYWYGDVLHLSFPVVNPRPFGLGLPGNWEQAVRLVEPWQDKSSGSAFMVMLHPTELVTQEFWDAVNFSKGTTHWPLKPAPVRPPYERSASLESFNRYIERMSQLSIEWCDVATLKTKIVPREDVAVSREELETALQEQGWGPIELSHATLSAAQSLYALCLMDAEGLAEVRVGMVGAPLSWTPATVDKAAADSVRRLAWARGLVRAVHEEGRLPSGPVAGLSLEQGMAAILAGKVDAKLNFLQYIKAPHQLHWDWPIFPENFRPTRLWHDARRLAWTLKRARWRDEGRRF